MSRHARERAQQRYNIELNRIDEKNILFLLNTGRGIPIEQESKDPLREFAYVHYNNIPLKVLYEKDERNVVKAIVTTYPFDVDEFNMVNKHKFEFQIDMAIKFLKKNNYIVYKKGSC